MVWGILAAMEGLDYLRVELVINPVDALHWTMAEEQILKPLRKVTRPRSFELILPFPRNPNINELPHAVVYRK